MGGNDMRTGVLALADSIEDKVSAPAAFGNIEQFHSSFLIGHAPANG